MLVRLVAVNEIGVASGLLDTERFALSGNLKCDIRSRAKIHQDQETDATVGCTKLIALFREAGTEYSRVRIVVSPVDSWTKVEKSAARSSFA